jgi:hypothetical protein
MSNDTKNQNKGPSHIAYHVREGEDNKAYFNRIGAAWQHKDGQGLNIQFDTLPIDGRVTVRTVQDRLQEAKENAQGDREGERRESARDDKRSSNRDDRRSRDDGPRYER